MCDMGHNHHERERQGFGFLVDTPEIRALIDETRRITETIPGDADRVAALATERMLSSSDLHQLRIQLVADAGAALFVLLITTALSVYKPWGMTAYGLRKQNEETAWHPPTTRRPAPWGKYVLMAIIGIVALVVLWHLVGGGLHGH